MRVGVISEGLADFAVVRSVVKGVMGLDAADVDPIRPELQTDETSLHAKGAASFSNWEIVKQECVEGRRIRAYLDSILDERRIVVVHIDSAECHLAGFDVMRPDRGSGSYVVDCRRAVAEAIHRWTAGDHAEHLVAAVAVEETDAWLIPLYDPEIASKERDSGTIRDAKKHLFRVLQRTGRLTATARVRILKERHALTQYALLSAPLGKVRDLREVLQHNASLMLFVDELCDLVERVQPGTCRLRPAAG